MKVAVGRLKAAGKGGSVEERARMCRESCVGGEDENLEMYALLDEGLWRTGVVWSLVVFWMCCDL